MRQSRLFVYYYIVLSAVFWFGRLYIIEAYHMKQGPVPQEAFHTLIEWVSLFAFLYIVPLLVAGFVGLIRFAKSKELPLFLGVLLSLLYIPLAIGAIFVLNFIFILLFYGFAP